MLTKSTFQKRTTSTFKAQQEIEYENDDGDPKIDEHDMARIKKKLRKFLRFSKLKEFSIKT